jgi:hypothetical protein
MAGGLGAGGGRGGSAATTTRPSPPKHTHTEHTHTHTHTPKPSVPDSVLSAFKSMGPDEAKDRWRRLVEEALLLQSERQECDAYSKALAGCAAKMYRWKNLLLLVNLPAFMPLSFYRWGRLGRLGWVGMMRLGSGASDIMGGMQNRWMDYALKTAPRRIQPPRYDSDGSLLAHGDTDAPTQHWLTALFERGRLTRAQVRAWLCWLPPPVPLKPLHPHSSSVQSIIQVPPPLKHILKQPLNPTPHTHPSL